MSETVREEGCVGCNVWNYLYDGKALYDYCKKNDCSYCVMKDINCNIEKMSDTQVITYYNMIEKESKKNL